MTDEQMRIAIAEACGWHEEKEPVGSAGATAWWHYNDRYPSYLMPVPDYLNDLNAMHEAVIKTFQDSSIQLDYSRMLIFVIKKSSPICKRFFSDFDLANATATQRAEAFLRTLGKWEK